MRSLFDSRMGRTAALGPRSHRGQSGFTLVETIVLIGLITVGLAGVLYLMAVGANLNIDTKDTLASYGAANELMEYIRQQPFANVTNVTDAPFGASTGQVGYKSLSQLNNPLGTYTVANYQSNTDIKQVTVTVKWTQKSQTRDRTVSVSTLVAQNGLNERWK